MERGAGPVTSSSPSESSSPNGDLANAIGSIRRLAYPRAVSGEFQPHEGRRQPVQADRPGGSGGHDKRIARGFDGGGQAPGLGQWTANQRSRVAAVPSKASSSWVTGTWGSVSHATRAMWTVGGAEGLGPEKSSDGARPANTTARRQARGGGRMEDSYRGLGRRPGVLAGEFGGERSSLHRASHPNGKSRSEGPPMRCAPAARQRRCFRTFNAGSGRARAVARRRAATKGSCSACRDAAPRCPRRAAPWRFRRRCRRRRR